MSGDGKPRGKVKHIPDKLWAACKQHPMKIGPKFTLIDEIEICRYHNYHRLKGCLRFKAGKCNLDHEICHWCGMPGHRALDCDVEEGEEALFAVVSEKRKEQSRTLSAKYVKRATGYKGTNGQQEQLKHVVGRNKQQNYNNTYASSGTSSRSTNVDVKMVLKNGAGKLSQEQKSTAELRKLKAQQQVAKAKLKIAKANSGY